MEEIGEIITKNFLSSKSIPFKKLGEYAAGSQPTETAKDEPAAAKKEEKAPEEAASPSKAEDAE